MSVGYDELRLLRALLRASDYGVLLSDNTRRDVISNKRMGELFGMNTDEIIQNSPESARALLLPRLKDPDGFLETLNAIYANPALIHEDEVELISPRPRLLRRFTAPVHDDDGNVIGRLWTFLDITRTRRLENKVTAQAAQLKEQARQLAVALRAVTGKLGKVENVLEETQRQLFESEKLSAIGLLAASVAHDIRNILTPLTIEATLADQNDPVGRGEALGVMRRQINQLDLLTHRLLALARPVSPEYRPVNIGTLLTHLAEILRTQLAAENVELVVRCPRALPRVLGDSAQLDQVLVNLALNAVQAMRATGGGTLTLRAARQRGDVVISVADTGPGVSRAARRRLFDPFFTTRPDGVGLGLYSCRRIVHAHGGVIRLRSVPGRETRFSLWLPGGETESRNIGEETPCREKS